MSKNRFVVNGKTYISSPSKDLNRICELCDLKEQCEGGNLDIIRKCETFPYDNNFQHIDKIENIINKVFYRFSTGTVFHINHIKDIIDIGYAEWCVEDPTKYAFTILMTNGVVIFVRFATKNIANRERNKFIKFIEEYETLDK